MFEFPTIDATLILNGILWYLAFLFSTTLHEASHAFTAMRLGDPTAYEGGHVTLSPFPHIRREPIGTVVVPILSYLASRWMIGWASVPYSMTWAVEHPRKLSVMSLAGPAANLLLVVLTGGLIRAGMAAGIFAAPASITFTRVTQPVDAGFYSPVATFLSILFSLNLLLGLFNLLPFPPLDGSGVLPLFLSRRAGQYYLLRVRTSALALVGLFLSWNLFQYIYSPIHLRAIRLLYPDLHYE